MTTRKQDEIGLWVALAFIAWTIAVCLSALFSAPRITVGGSHEAPRVTPGPVAGRAAGSRTPHTQGTTQHDGRGASVPRLVAMDF